jgi:TM2 domain-containing membrane protein YozV
MGTDETAERVNRLLTTAHVQRMRGNLDEAHRACEEAITLEPENAVALDMLGDLEAARGELDTAMLRYRKAFQLDPRPATEEKIALLALRIDEKRRGEAGADSLFPDATRRRLNPSLACALSMLFPGLGQLYNGEYRKGLAFIIIWVLLLPNLYLVVSAIIGPLVGHGPRHIPGFVWLIALLQAGVVIASLMDASLAAVAINRGKTQEKSGWEV